MPLAAVRPASLLALVLAIAISALAASARAQAPATREQPSALGAGSGLAPPVRLDVAGLVLATPASEVALAIRIAGSAALPANTYVRIRGLAPQMALTAGHAIAPGAWAVPLAALAELHVVIPVHVTGKLDVEIALLSIDGGAIATAHTALIVSALPTSPAPPSAQPAVVSPPAPVAPVAPVVPVAPIAPPAPVPAPVPAPRPQIGAAIPQAEPPPPAPPRPAPLSPADRARADAFMDRGRRLLEDGNIVSARLFFERAAEAGLAEGALEMGATFDANELARRPTVSLAPDPAEARRWYERARALGLAEAAEARLARLGTAR